LRRRPIRSARRALPLEEPFGYLVGDRAGSLEVARFHGILDLPQTRGFRLEPSPPAEDLDTRKGVDELEI